MAVDTVEIPLQADIADPFPVVKILALSGGGYRGLFTATILKAIEEEYKKPLREVFDLIIGTSVGALLASGLALGLSATNVQAAFLRHGPLIFSHTPRLKYWARKGTFRPPYAQSNLRSAIENVLTKDNAHKQLSEMGEKFAAVALNYSTGRPQLFATKLFTQGARSDVRLVDAVLASAAAPTYFPPYRTGRDVFLDGGLVANAPELLGFWLLKKNRMTSDAKIRVISIGTAAQQIINDTGEDQIARQANVQKTRLRRTRNLVNSVLAAQESMSIDLASAILGQAYYRMDIRPSESQARKMAGLDWVTPESTRLLIRMAEEAWEENRLNIKFQGILTA